MRFYAFGRISMRLNVFVCLCTLGQGNRRSMRFLAIVCVCMRLYSFIWVFMRSYAVECSYVSFSEFVCICAFIYDCIRFRAFSCVSMRLVAFLCV